MVSVRTEDIGRKHTGFLLLLRPEAVEGIVRAVWAVVKSVTKGIWLRNGNDIRWKAGQLGGGALVERPPTIRVQRL